MTEYRHARTKVKSDHPSVASPPEQVEEPSQDKGYTLGDAALYGAGGAAGAAILAAAYKHNPKIGDLLKKALKFVYSKRVAMQVGGPVSRATPERMARHTYTYIFGKKVADLPSYIYVLISTLVAGIGLKLVEEKLHPILNSLISSGAFSNNATQESAGDTGTPNLEDLSGAVRQAVASIPNSILGDPGFWGDSLKKLLAGSNLLDTGLIDSEILSGDNELSRVFKGIIGAFQPRHEAPVQTKFYMLKYPEVVLRRSQFTEPEDNIYHAPNATYPKVGF